MMLRGQCITAAERQLQLANTALESSHPDFKVLAPQHAKARVRIAEAYIQLAQEAPR